MTPQIIPPRVQLVDPRTGMMAREWFRFLEFLTTRVNAPEAAWPVGSVFTTVSASEPKDLLGFGTWSAFGAGRVLVGFDASDMDFDAIEEPGGAKTSTPTGTVSQPTFTGSPLATHDHGAGSLETSAHAGAAVGDHASHTHGFTQDANEISPTLLAEDLITGVAASGTTGNESATLTHDVTQPDDHTMSGDTEAVSAGTPSGTVSQPTFTGDAQSIQQKYIVVKLWKRTA